jgi:hypothetical protein
MDRGMQLGGTRGCRMVLASLIDCVDVDGLSNVLVGVALLARVMGWAGEGGVCHVGWFMLFPGGQMQP